MSKRLQRSCDSQPVRLTHRRPSAVGTSLAFCLVLPVLLCIGASAAPPPSEASGEVGIRQSFASVAHREPPDWRSFAAARDGYLHRLAKPIVACVRRRDTAHAVFRGCIDWHSSVHAHYALFALYRLTGRRAFLQAAERSLTQTGLRREYDALRSRALLFERPYGYAWFLALAVERERATGQRDLRPIASEVASQLQDWISSRSPQQIKLALAASDYENLSWPLINLLAWADHIGSSSSVAWRSFVRKHVTRDITSNGCVGRDSAERAGFLPPCLLRVLVALEATSSGKSRAALVSRLRASYENWTPLRPTEIYAHSAGLNFSRSWAFWEIFRATRDTRWRREYIEHMTALISHPQFWAMSYYLYAHWVAQFGVYALSRSFP